MHHWISFYLIPVNVRWWQTSLHAFRVSRGPDLLILPVQHQFAIIGQVKTAYVTVGFGGVCVPPGLVIIVVHDQVAVSLHAQAGSVWSCSVWSPQRLPAVDNKVTVVLQGTKTHLIDSKMSLPKHCTEIKHKLLTWKTALYSPLLESRKSPLRSSSFLDKKFLLMTLQQKENLCCISVKHWNYNKSYILGVG